MTKDLYFAKPEQISKTNTNNPTEKKSTRLKHFIKEAYKVREPGKVLVYISCQKRAN